MYPLVEGLEAGGKLHLPLSAWLMWLRPSCFPKRIGLHLCGAGVGSGVGGCEPKAGRDGVAVSGCEPKRFGYMAACFSHIFFKFCFVNIIYFTTFCQTVFFWQLFATS